MCQYYQTVYYFINYINVEIIAQFEMIVQCYVVKSVIHKSFSMCKGTRKEQNKQKI